MVVSIYLDIDVVNIALQNVKKIEPVTNGKMSKCYITDRIYRTNDTIKNLGRDFI